MKQLLVSLFTILFALPLAAQAQQPPVPTATDEIVVTASALPEELQSTPAAATVVTRAEIEQRAARDVAEVLREVPGVVISRSGSAGRATSLFTRGSNSNHTLVLWNGIEITNPYFAGYDWGRFSTVGVEQVEVVRGPYSALYGSDAVAGVVNVLTNPLKSELRASLEGGGHGLLNGNVAAAYVAGPATLSLAYETREDDGFARNDDFAQDSLSGTVRWKATSTLSLGLSARHTSYDLGIPTNTNANGDALVPSPSRRQDGNETQIAIPIEQTLGNFSYELTLAESRRDDRFVDPDDPFGLVETVTESSTRRARLATRLKTASFGTLVAGGEYERAEVDDFTNFGANLDRNRRTEKSLFVEDRLTHTLNRGRLELSAGARWDHFDTFGSELSPRVAAAFIAGPGKIRAGYGEAFRAPAIGELYFPFFGNRELEAERSRSFELGYDHNLHRGPLSVTLFRADYDDLIVFDLVTNRFGNVGRANAQGVEVGIQQALTANFDASLSYTYTETEEEGADRPLARRPKHSGSLFVAYRIGAIHTNVSLLHQGARADVLPIFPYGRVTNEAYTTVDANVQYRLGRFTPFVKVENLLDEEYEEVLGYPSPRRRASVGLRFTL